MSCDTVDGENPAQPSMYHTIYHSPRNLVKVMQVLHPQQYLEA